MLLYIFACSYLIANYNDWLSVLNKHTIPRTTMLHELFLSANYYTSRCKQTCITVNTRQLKRKYHTLEVCASALIANKRFRQLDVVTNNAYEIELNLVTNRHVSPLSTRTLYMYIAHFYMHINYKQIFCAGKNTTIINTHAPLLNTQL